MRTQDNKNQAASKTKVLVLRHDVKTASVSALLALGFSVVLLNKGE